MTSPDPQTDRQTTYLYIYRLEEMGARQPMYLTPSVFMRQEHQENRLEADRESKKRKRAGESQEQQENRHIYKNKLSVCLLSDVII